MPETNDSNTGPNAAGGRFRISDDDTAVVVRKVFTRMGERLELTAVPLGESVRMDAIMLESVAWQPAGELAERAGRLADEQFEDPSAGAGGSDGHTDEDEARDSFTVSNEFALAEIERVTDDGRESLHVHAPKLGYENRLGARELAWLACQDHETFTEWLETPFGPEEDHH